MRKGKKICGIYKITSPTGKVYIGQSVDIHDRFRKYKSLKCKDQQALFNSLKKHGVEKHIFEIINICDVSELNDLEIHYSNLFKSTTKEFGLNIRDCGGAKGLHSEETKIKIGLAHKGKVVSENTKQLLRDANKGKHDGEKNNNYGKKMSKELKEKLLSIRKGSVASEETRKKQSESHKGKFVSEETRMKISLIHKGRVVSEETKQKMRKPKNEEHKRNLSDAKRKYYENIRQEKALMIF